MAVRFVGALMAIAVASVATGATAEQQYEWLRLDRHHVKWGAPVAGSGTVVTYAFADRPVHLSDARNCRDVGPLDALAAGSGLSVAAVQAEVQAAFAMWAAVADIRFRRVDDAGKANILIGAQTKPAGVAFADVAQGEANDDGMRSIRRSLVCLNPEKRWTAGFDGDSETYDLRYAFAHEIGHAIGLDHPGPSGQLMSFRYEERFRELQPGDIAGAAGLYGGPAATVAAGVTGLEQVPAAADGDAVCPDSVAPEAGNTALAPGGSRC